MKADLFSMASKINNLMMYRYHGRNREFKPTTNRDIALVNKDCDFVKDEHSVPPKWRQDLNRNMVKTEDGRWMLAQRPQLVDNHEDIDHHLTQLGLLSSNKS